MDDGVRHICGISGGKDSSALAAYLRGKVPEMEYFFCDTGAELPETYEYLTRLEVILGKPIVRLNARRGFDHWFEVFRGALPSPQMRWCTKNMKIKPIEEWIGDEPAISYVAIRADEANRKGYISTKSNIETRFPFVEDGINHDDVLRILSDAGIGLPAYYEWRSTVRLLLLLLPAQSRMDRPLGTSPGPLRARSCYRAEGPQGRWRRWRRRLRRPSHARPPIHMVRR